MSKKTITRTDISETLKRNVLFHEQMQSTVLNLLLMKCLYVSKKKKRLKSPFLVFSFHGTNKQGLAEIQKQCKKLKFPNGMLSASGFLEL